MGEDTRNARLMVTLNGVGTAYFDPRPAVVNFLEKARRCGAPDWDIYGQRPLPGYTRPPFSLLRERSLKTFKIRCPFFTGCSANATVEPVRLKPTYNDSIFRRIVVVSRRPDSVQPPIPNPRFNQGRSDPLSNHRRFDLAVQPQSFWWLDGAKRDGYYITSSSGDSDFDDMGAPKEESILLKNSLNSNENEKPKKYPFPKGVIFILGNEFCERFSYYGMRAILILYLTQRLEFHRDVATLLFHAFAAICYIMPLAGAVLADSYFGRYKVILYLSFVYLSGNVVMATTAMAPPHWLGPIVALILIGIGTGGIKPCVGAFGGDQFHPDQTKELDQFFSIFYLAINIGSFISTLLTPYFRAHVQCFGGDCYALAFGVPAILMGIALFLFICGRSLYKVKPPAGNLLGKMVRCVGISLRNKLSRGSEPKAHWLDYAEDRFEPDFIVDMKRLMMVLWLFLPLPLFWALFDQQGSRWTLQAELMDGHLWGDWYLEPDQIQALNPVLIIVLIPLSECIIYPLLAKCGLLTKHLQRMGVGMFLAAIAFVVAGVLQLQIEKAAEFTPNGTMSAVTFVNDAPCNLTILTGHVNRSIATYEATEHIMIPHGDTTIQFSVEESECHNMTRHTVSLTLSLRAGSGYCVIVGNRNSQLITTYFDYTKMKPKHGQALVNVVYMEQGNLNLGSNPQASGHYVTMIDHNNKTYVYSTTDFAGTPYFYVESGKYRMLEENSNQISSEELVVKSGGVYTIIVHPNILDTHKLNAVQFVNTPSAKLSMLYQIPQYFTITIGEILFSISGLQFAYSQSPASMKSVLQAAWLLTVAVGNMLDMLVAGSSWVPDPAVEFFVFAGLMVVMVFIFSLMAYFYKYVTPSSDYYPCENDEAGLVDCNGEMKLDDLPTSEDK
ncbi:Solute carrier family 15 member 1 [Lamellibrachia satsuma]|nr:Solute carrier family 15 member 1 [Lamellibrachia satsuma]